MAHLINLSEHKPLKSSSSKFGFDVKFTTKQYHLVHNRNMFGNEDSIQLLATNDATKSKAKFPAVKMNLQTNRPPNLVQLHDGRFEDINKEPKILSTVKKVKQIDFDKYQRKGRHECLINGDNDVSMQKYQIKEDIVKPRTNQGNISLSKQTDWSQLI